MLDVYIGTNGCEEGQLSSMYVEQFFRMNNSIVTRDPTQADLIVFYACGLTEQKENDSLMVIKKLQAKMKPTARFVVWGCLPKINPKPLAAIYDGPLIGPKDTSFFETISGTTKIPFEDINANTLVSSERTKQAYALSDLPVLLMRTHKLWNTRFPRQGHSQNTPFYIRVAAGCTGHCTYCSERCAFGGITSRPIDKIISNFKEGLQKGYKRFFLCATDLGPYGTDIGCTLSNLLETMVQINSERDYRIILNQLNPSYLIEMYSDLEKILDSGKIEEICCPVQSGSNRILKLMGRRYTAEKWREYILRINRRFPNIRLSTHFMVGFPTESNEDFRATLRLLDYPLFLYNIITFKFSERPTVHASRLSEHVPNEVKESRYKKLLRKHAYMYALNVTTRKIRNAYTKLPA